MNVTMARVAEGDRVIDTRCGTPATVEFVNYDGRKGSDGFGIVVAYDDDPDSPVSTGTDYFNTLDRKA